MFGTVCVCEQLLRNGMYGEQFFFLLKKEPMGLREAVRFGPSLRPHDDFLLSFIQKNAAFVPDSEAFNRRWLSSAVLKGGSEASDHVQADNVSNEASYVI